MRVLHCVCVGTHIVVYSIGMCGEFGGEINQSCQYALELNYKYAFVFLESVFGVLHVLELNSL